jgi:hypothetical protein
VKRWLAAIREHKAEIIEALKVSPGDMARMLAKLLKDQRQGIDELRQSERAGK